VCEEAEARKDGGGGEEAEVGKGGGGFTSPQAGEEKGSWCREITYAGKNSERSST
jgi:hypothetical protein